MRKSSIGIGYGALSIVVTSAFLHPAYGSKNPVKNDLVRRHGRSGTPSVAELNVKYQQAKQLRKSGDLAAARTLYEQVSAGVDARKFGSSQDIQAADGLKERALLHQLEIATALKDPTQIRPLIQKIQKAYPETSFELVRRALVQLGDLTQMQADQMKAEYDQAERSYKPIGEAWNLRKRQNPGDLAGALRPLIEDNNGVGFRARLLLARVLFDARKPEEAFPLIVNLWRVMPPESLFRETVQTLLWKEAEKAGEEELVAEVLPFAVNSRQADIRVAARVEWVWRLRKMARHQEVFALADEAIQDWNVYLATVNHDESVDTQKAVLLLEAGVALKAMNRFQEASRYLAECQAVAQALPDQVVPIEDRKTPTTNPMKEPLLENIRIELAR